MSYIRRNQKNYIKKEFEGEETEEIEEIEVNRYDSNDLYPTSLNFIIPGKSKFSTRSHNPKHKYIRKQIKLPVRSIPICTCKLPNSNYQNNYFNKMENRLPTYTNTCPYCIYENELMNENLSFKTEIDDLNYNIEINQNNDYNNQNQYRSMRNIRDNYQNEKYIMNPVPRLNRREIPYENERIYIMPYSKNNPSYEYTIMNQNISRKNNNLEDDNIFLRDKRIVKIIRDNKIINLNETDGDTNKNIQNNNNFYVVEQKTNDFIIDNEIMPNKNINLKNKTKDIEKKNKDINQIYNINNSQKINQNMINKNEQNLVKSLDIKDLKEDKEKNYNLTEENENTDNNNKNINIDVLENNIIPNYNSEDKVNNNEEHQNELLNDYNCENKENDNLIENSNHENLEKNIIPSDENKDLNNNENAQEIKDIDNVNNNENENKNLNDEQQIEENKIHDMNLKSNSNNLNDNYKKEENEIFNEEEKEVEENQEPKEENNINIKTNNLDKPNNELDKNNENNNILNQNEDIKEENEEQNEIEKEKFQLKQKEYYLNNNDNIEEVDENIEDEYNINNKENEDNQESKENEEPQQKNTQKEEDININQNKGIQNYDSPGNTELNDKNNDIKTNNKKEIEKTKSINQKLDGELNENININKIFNEKNETDYQPSSSSKKKVITENNNFKYKIPQTGELLFNPKTGRKKNVEPLFSKYEQLEGQERYQNINSLTQPKETMFKKTVEIFPSRFGIEMPYKSQLRQDDYSLNNNNLEKKNLSKTTSDKKSKKMNRNQKLANKDHLNIAKFEKKTYYKYKSNIKSNNPFIGLSQYDKNTKERKNIISKRVQKEENEFNDIIIFEENILKKRDLTEEELNQFINILIKYMFESEEKNLNNKDAYEFKINKISNIIINMKKEEQNKVLEELKNNAKDEYSNELFTQLKTKITDFKDKIAKSYKKEENLEDEEFENISNSSNKKKYKK